MQRVVESLTALLVMSCACRGLVADEYWTDTYKGFEVTTVGGAGRALGIARNLARFDLALTNVLKLTGEHLPTRIYELSPKQARDLIGENSSSYKFNGYDVLVVSKADDKNYYPYWGPLFGYSGSLLVSGRALRSPFWYRIGVPAVFSNTQFEVDDIRTGGVQTGFARTLVSSNWIPTRILLRMENGDPQLKNQLYWEMVGAESWFIAYEILVRGKFNTEFGRYLAEMRDGKAEEQAFSDSFKFSYEDLDKEMIKAMREPSYSFTVKVPREPIDPSEARHLSAAEADSRLAELYLEIDERRDEASRLATQALQEDPKNELALNVITRVDLKNEDYPGAFASLGKLETLPPSSARGCADAGRALVLLAEAVSGKKASIGTEAEDLSRRAKDEFERAINIDQDYLAAWTGLATLYSARHDATGAQALMGRAHAVMEKHSGSAALAHAFARMSFDNGLASDAVFFGDYWRNNADSLRDRDSAIAFLQRARAH